MEEWVGGIWHQFITRKASAEFDQARVNFTEVHKSVGIVYRALGGDPSKRVEAASTRDYLSRRSFLQKISGDNQQMSLAWQDEDSLRLPEYIAVFPDQALNADLYIWLTVLGAHHSGQFKHWAIDNQQLVVDILANFPALKARYQRLAEAVVQLRLNVDNLPIAEQALEKSIVEAILKPGTVSSFPAVNYAPQAVFLWLYPSAQTKPIEAAVTDDDFTEATSENSKKQSKTARKKTERVESGDDRDGMMIFRLESLFSWSEFANIDRGSDDSDDDGDKVAEDLDKITLSQQQDQKSARIKLDLDLPSSSEDDLPLGEGITLPEWDYRKQQLVIERCLLQPMLPKDSIAKKLPLHLQKTAKNIQAQFEQLQSLRYWLKNQPQGEELDLNAWLDFHIERQISPTAETGLYRSFRGNNRDLSCLLLADLSMSTDSHLDDETRVIDVVRDSMLLFGEALNIVGDNFAMYGFSSVKRSHVRFSVLKNFKESYDDTIRGRIQAIRPGFYTRMGAAIRQSTKILLEQKSSQKLLLILTDGKPNDIDHYEGRFGIEDTRQAIIAAKQAGLKPFCITIDQEAEDYLPYIFGRYSFSVMRSPTQLPTCLPQIYHRLTSQ